MRRYIWLTPFAIAMAFLETAVVVYLRELYYPKGFEFPLTLMPPKLALVEVAREAATIVMLFVAGRLGTNGGWRGFAGFMFLFGVWDIFYYVWLKVILDWPASLATWDILFLIPVPWIGPVWAPVVISLSLIAGALAVEHLLDRGHPVRVGVTDCAALTLAGLIVIVSFTLDWRLAVEGGVPQHFDDAWIFWVGELLGLAILVRAWRRSRASHPAPPAPAISGSRPRTT